jgi:NhaP-type Na+/H+ or K+/H+ antiporter
MKYLLAIAFIAANFIFPVAAWAEANLKSPLSYSLREYGVILGIALLGGFAAWVRRVRRGETDMFNITALIGELAISAFAGLVTFWLCESFELSPLITAAAAGMAGHAGGNGITWFEKFGKRYIEKKFGVTGPAPLGEK